MNGRVLVVDDEQSLRGLIRGILEQEGLVAESAESVDEALEKLGRVSYDLVLVDVVLEEGSGLDVLAGVRDAGVAAQTNPQTPVVIVTAAPALESAIQAVRLGAFDYVVKPVRRAQLLAVAGRALDHKTLVDHKARLEESLRTRERNFAILLDSIEDTVLLVDASGRIQLANQAAATRMGREPAELVGRTMTELDLPPQLVASRMEWLRRVVNLGRPAYFEDERPPYLFDISMFPAPGSGGSVERVAVVARDVTQARRDKADLAEARQDRADMAVRLKSLEERLQSRRGLGSLVGGSPAMEEVFARIGQAAVVDSAVLVTGEAGTGRELVAAVIHQAGPRSVGPLERVDCSVMEEHLLESELFGHVRGAFPGAVRQRKGRLEAAQGGTLFLDDVDRLPPTLQRKLLRFLEQGEFEPLGATQPLAADVRVVAATSHKLSDLVRRGQFREDLFYLFRAMVIEVPPLRERTEDIRLLAEHFLVHFGAVFDKRFAAISPEALQAMLTHVWPGNVRELKHAMEHAAIRCAGEEVLPLHLPREVVVGPRSDDTGRRAGRDAVLRALHTCRWNKTRAARLLGISRGTLYSRMKDFDILQDAS